MKKDVRIEREIDKKHKRNYLALNNRKLQNLNLYAPVAPKKPLEMEFDKNNIKSFEFPIAIGNTVFELKRDGFGIDIIIDDEIKIFSLDGNLWDVNCFPELIDDLQKLPKGYFRGEIFGKRPYNTPRFTSLDEFTAIQNRPKTDSTKVTSDLIKKYPLRIELFDVLRVNDSSMLFSKLSARRKLLETIITTINPTENFGLVLQWNIDEPLVLQELFQEVIDDGDEGLVAKDPDSFYVPGSRDADWLKMKKFTTIDLAVLGLYETDSSIKAGKPFASVLVGTFNKTTKRFETMTKVKIGKKTIAEEILQLTKSISKIETTPENILDVKSNIDINPMILKQKKKVPFKLFNYEPTDDILIIEVQILDVTFTENWHSCGFDQKTKKAHSLRIPTFVRIRNDKTKAVETTTTDQIQHLFFG